MKKKTLIIIFVIAAICIAAYFLFKRRKKAKTVNVNINDLTKTTTSPGNLQLLAQSASGATPVTLPGLTGFPLKKGDTGINVAKLQTALITKTDGIFDDDLERKVIAAIGVKEVSEEKFKYLMETRQWQPFLNLIPSVHDVKLSDAYYKQQLQKLA